MSQMELQPDESAFFLEPETTVPLENLRASGGTQYVVCPHCHQKNQVRMEKEGTQHHCWLNWCMWPLPNRKHWLEWNHWFCKGCGRQLAKQKWGKEVIVMAPRDLDK